MHKLWTGFRACSRPHFQELGILTDRLDLSIAALEMDAPEVDLVLLQQRLKSEMKAKLGQAALRKAILVPNTKLAYLARIAFGQFGEGDYWVFYNDIHQAVRWLEDCLDS